MAGADHSEPAIVVREPGPSCAGAATGLGAGSRFRRSNRPDRLPQRSGIGALGMTARHMPLPAEDLAVAPRLTPRARTLLRDQRGVIADWQAASVGLDRRRLMNATRDGWRLVSPHVFADRDEDLREDQMRMVGVLEGGPGAALAGCSALVEAGWKGSELGHVDVHSPRGRRRRAQGMPAWLRFHEPRDEPRIHGFPARCTARGPSSMPPVGPLGSAGDHDPHQCRPAAAGDRRCSHPGS